MNTIKRFACALLFFPLISCAAPETSYQNISPMCYRTFTKIFSLLPSIAPEYGYIVSNMNTPDGNPSIYTFTVEFTPSGLGLGHYALHQRYSKNTLYLRLDAYPDTFPLESTDEVWEVIGKLLETCPILDH